MSIVKLRFKQYLAEQFNRPYIKASTQFKEILDAMDENERTQCKQNLLKISEGFDPETLRLPANLQKWHVCKPPIGSEYSEAHLSFKHVMIFCAYKKAILYLDIVKHKILESEATSKQEARRLEFIRKSLIEQVEQTWAKHKLRYKAN